VQDLQRDLSLMPEVLGQIHSGHATCTELAFDAVPSERISAGLGMGRENLLPVHLGRHHSRGWAGLFRRPIGASDSRNAADLGSQSSTPRKAVDEASLRIETAVPNESTARHRMPAQGDQTAWRASRSDFIPMKGIAEGHCQRGKASEVAHHKAAEKRSEDGDGDSHDYHLPPIRTDAAAGCSYAYNASIMLQRRPVHRSRDTWICWRRSATCARSARARFFWGR
jgi:hypothetical protein